MPDDDFTSLLPPVPEPRELPRRELHRAALLAVLAAERQPPVRLARRRGWAGARRLLVPLAAAAAVAAVVLATVALPRPGPARSRSARPASPAGQSGRGLAIGSGRLTRPRSWRVSAAGIDTVVLATTAGSVDVAGDLAGAETVGAAGSLAAGRALGSVRVAARPAYRGTAPVIVSKVSGTVLTISARCLPGGDASCRVSLGVTLPPGMNLRVSTALGTVVVAGTTGRVAVTDNLGDIRLWDLAGPVTAVADLGSINGERLTSPRATLTADLGTINAAFAAAPALIDATDQDGSVTVTVPATSSYLVTARAQLGGVTVTVPRSASRAHLILASSQLGSVTITG
jgi:hypothetical protein